jgi:hypothetical protein
MANPAARARAAPRRCARSSWGVGVPRSARRASGGRSLGAHSLGCLRQVVIWWTPSVQWSDPNPTWPGRSGSRSKPPTTRAPRRWTATGTSPSGRRGPLQDPALGATSSSRAARSKATLVPGECTGTMSPDPPCPVPSRGPNTPTHRASYPHGAPTQEPRQAIWRPHGARRGRGTRSAGVPAAPQEQALERIAVRTGVLKLR